jgi:hypothetical protein
VPVGVFAIPTLLFKKNLQVETQKKNWAAYAFKKKARSRRGSCLKNPQLIYRDPAAVQSRDISNNYFKQ